MNFSVNVIPTGAAAPLKRRRGVEGSRPGGTRSLHCVFAPKWREYFGRDDDAGWAEKQ